jgi:hypothetical protein
LKAGVPVKIPAAQKRSFLGEIQKIPLNFYWLTTTLIANVAGFRHILGQSDDCQLSHDVDMACIEMEISGETTQLALLSLDGFT